MKQRTTSITAAALLLVSSGAVSAAWDCGHDVPDCVKVTLEAREVWTTSDCAYPTAIQIIVENGPTGISVFPDGHGMIYLSHPIDFDPENPARYTDYSCCEDSTEGYSCAPDQRPAGVASGE